MEQPHGRCLAAAAGGRQEGRKRVRDEGREGRTARASERASGGEREKRGYAQRRAHRHHGAAL